MKDIWIRRSKLGTLHTGHFSNKGKELQHNIDEWNAEYNKRNMTINRKMMKMMVLGKKQENIRTEHEERELEN